MKPLSPKQKAVLCQLASRAYYAVGASLSYDSIEQFRHACVFDATGKSGLTACDQLDYVPVYNYFAELLGMDKKVDRTPRDARERALWVLRDSMRRWEFNEAYVVKIVMARFKLVSMVMPMFDELIARCSAEDLRQINYTVINRGRARARKLEAEHGLPMAQEVHVSAATLPPGGLAAHFNSEQCAVSSEQHLSEQCAVSSEQLDFRGLEPEGCKAVAEPYPAYEQ